MLQQFAARKGIDYPLLSDPGSKVIRAFGILNTEIPPGNLAYGIPYPGTYIINADGTVRAKFFEPEHWKRYTAADILFHEFGDDAGHLKRTIETPRLRVTISASDAVVHTGSRVALVVDVTLKPHIHVYAPGVEGGYIPVEWRMPATGGWSVLPATYPKARPLRLAAIHETVPVYEGHFRISRDLVIGLGRQLLPFVHDGQLSVTGSFRYQACDETTCYRPRTLPLEWIFRLAPHER